MLIPEGGLLLAGFTLDAAGFTSTSVGDITRKSTSSPASRIEKKFHLLLGIGRIAIIRLVCRNITDSLQLLLVTKTRARLWLSKTCVVGCNNCFAIDGRTWIR